MVHLFKPIIGSNVLHVFEKESIRCYMLPCHDHQCTGNVLPAVQYLMKIPCEEPLKALNKTIVMYNSNRVSTVISVCITSFSIKIGSGSLTPTLTHAFLSSLKPLRAETSLSGHPSFFSYILSLHFRNVSFS